MYQFFTVNGYLCGPDPPKLGALKVAKEKEMIMTTNSQTMMPNQEEFAGLVKRANAGDDDALARMRQTLDSNPEIWESVGNLATHAQLSMVKLIAGGNKLVSESLLRKAEQMKGELAGASPSKLEKLAVERIVACWLEMEYWATTYPVAKGETLGQARFALKQKESSERRFNAAMKSLTTLRALLPSGDVQSSDHYETKEHAHSKSHVSGKQGKPHQGMNGKRKPRVNGHTNNRLKAYLDESEPVTV
jgi:hypothetical protein